MTPLMLVAAVIALGVALVCSLADGHSYYNTLHLRTIADQDGRAQHHACAFDGERGQGDGCC